ncbi:MerC domain-containing protein [Mucilaginibacter psychrotolerans]|uniref:MerC domain-containing protein n=1 Tax=Mucilaginibacter psychrotolerans TaxID=1524096 RepID=A0A4Y8SCI1_9SPHI|nr:MerC domain-containing protein [Mucilaginibacter psychrotolerans]TFF36335.1 MerC domain-containing protein [Mucilaginibacter psychrotolerans]
MKLLKAGAKLDNIGMTASTLCAIHCAAVPVFFSSLPLVGMGFLANPWVEWGMIILALIIGVSSIGGSFFNAHRRVLPLALLIIGFATIILGHIFTKGWLEAVIVPIGGITIAVAHFVNYKYAGTCTSGDSFLHVTHKHQ